MTTTAQAPVVSVLVPSYNAAPYITSCIESIISQTYAELEIIVVDDCSTDDSYEILANLARGDERVKLLRNEVNLGNVANFQRCLELATGPLIKFVCCDDVLRADVVARMVEVMQARPDIALVASQRNAIDASGQVLTDASETLRSLTPFDGTAGTYALSGYEAGDSLLTRLCNWIGEPTTVMFRAEKLSADDPFSLGRARPARNLDVVWWLKIMAGSNIGYINEPLSSFRHQAGQVTRRRGVQADLLLSWYDILLGALDLGYLGDPQARVTAFSSLANVIVRGAATLPHDNLPRISQILVEIAEQAGTLAPAAAADAPDPRPSPSTTTLAATQVPFVDLGPINSEIRAAVAESWATVIDASAFVLGAEVSAFEEEFAGYYETAHCIAVANGTDALEIAMRSLGIGSGDEVIVPAFTFAASGIAVARAGATPVFVDVDPDTLLLDPQAVEAAIGPRTSAVLAVNLYGQPAPLAQLSEIADRHGLALIEDGAQSHGARQAGRLIGPATACFCTSFYPTKNLGAWGDGGALVTDDPDLAAQARLIRNYGSATKYDHSAFGFNSRLDTLQASVLRAKLPHLDDWNSGRRAAAEAYSALLADVPQIRLPATAPGNTHVWHQYSIRVPSRDAVMAELERRAIGVGVHYPHALPSLPIFGKLGQPAGQWPVAEAAAASVLSLPMYVGITPQALSTVAANVAEVVACHS